MHFFNDSGLYTHFPAFSTLTLDAGALLGNAFMLQPFAVPTFGSNGMLYLLSYLFWTVVLSALFVHAAAPGRPWRRHARLLLTVVAILAMPAPFLAWSATWLAGVAVVALGEARSGWPPILLACALFATLLLASRLAGADTTILPAPFGAWLIQCKYLIVGAGFALVAWALYPHPAHGERARMPSPAAAQAAAFAFFCHFPVLMLLAGAGATLLDTPLMRQPAPAGYAPFACLVMLCTGATTLAARATAATVRILAPARRRPGLPVRGRPRG